jgi:ribosomal-protein-alanine N-acetyltransferase
MDLPVIRTEHLLLRPAGAADVDELHRLWMDPDMRRYLWDDIVIAREVAAETVRRGFYWTVRSAADGEAIGFCGFRAIGSGPDIELMYGLLRPHWGCGFATEVSRAVLEFVWNNTGHERVFARTDPPNVKSVEVMRRLGMRPQSATATMITYVIDRSENGKCLDRRLYRSAKDEG